MGNIVSRSLARRSTTRYGSKSNEDKENDNSGSVVAAKHPDRPEPTVEKKDEGNVYVEVAILSKIRKTLTDGRIILSPLSESLVSQYIPCIIAH